MPNRTVVLIASDVLGRGDDELGRALMLAAIKNLPKAAGGPPSAVLFMNAGVLLCCSGSHALADLTALSEAGVRLLSCGTCLDWYEKSDDLAAGGASNMVEILSEMNGAERVVKL